MVHQANGDWKSERARELPLLTCPRPTSPVDYDEPRERQQGQLSAAHGSIMTCLRFLRLLQRASPPAPALGN
jgi:hypothetical protein